MVDVEYIRTILMHDDVWFRMLLRILDMWHLIRWLDIC